MFERGVCVLVVILSLFSVFYSSKSMDIYTDVAYVGKSNYMDVVFTDVSSSNGSQVSVTPSGRGLELNSISLSKVGEMEVIRYTVLNNSYSYDVDVEVLVNGEKIYNNEFFTIEASSIGELNHGSTTTGEIKITLKKAALESISVPFNVEMNLTPKQKGYLS